MPTDAPPSPEAWLMEKFQHNERLSRMKQVDFTDIPLGERPEMNVWQVLIEQVAQELAILFQDGEAYTVQFPDEAEPIPFEYLAYHHKLGLYDTRKFPDVR